MSKQNNVVQLGLPEDKTSLEKLNEFIVGRNPKAVVVFGIDEDGTPFIAHTPAKATSMLIVYLDTVRQLLQDEIITMDATGRGLIYEDKTDDHNS